MTTYPYATPDGIIELVHKDEHDAVVSELEQEVRDNTDLRQRSHEKSVEITRWQSLAERLATNLQAVVQLSDRATLVWDAAKEALTAYESAAKGEQP